MTRFTQSSKARTANLSTEARPASGERTVIKRLGGIVTWPNVCAAILGLIVIAAIVGPALLGSGEKIDVSKTFQPPIWAGGSWEHVLGTDNLGRDILSRLVSGARISLIVAVAAVLLAGIGGTIIGLAAGYFGGAVDSVAARLIDAQLAFPLVALALAVVVAFGPSTPVVICVIAVTSWVAYARVVRGEVMSLRNRDFVALAQTAGMREVKILLRHLLPNVMPSIIVLASLDLARVIIYEASLSFLGLGVQPPNSSWGLMISEGRVYLATEPFVVLIPAAALVVLTISANVLGDSLRDRLDPALLKKGV